MQTEKFETWGIVELFGHTKIAGLLSEATIAGGTFLRVDVPPVNSKLEFTRFFGAGAIYSITPTSEDIARQAAIRIDTRPITVYGVVLPEQPLLVPSSEPETPYHDEWGSLADEPLQDWSPAEREWHEGMGEPEEWDDE